MNDYGFVCVRHESIKTTNNANSREKHNFDKSFRDTLKHVNHDKTEQNITFYSNYDEPEVSISETFKSMSKKYEEIHNKKLRKDAVKAIETIYAISNDIIDLENDEQVQRFKDAVVNCHKKYAKDCPFKLVIHVDEKTIHGQVLTIPYNEKGEAFRNKILSPNALKKIQDDFALYCQEQQIDVVRGMPKKITKAKHMTSYQYAQEQQMKEQEAKANAELQEEIEAERKRRLKVLDEEINEEAEKQKEQLAKLHKEIDIAFQDKDIAEEEAKQARAEQRYQERKAQEYKAKADKEEERYIQNKAKADKVQSKVDDYGQFFDMSYYDDKMNQSQQQKRSYNIETTR